MTSSSGNDVITKLFEIVANHVQTIIFKTWGLKLLYLLWFRRESDYKSCRFGNDCIYLSVYLSVFLPNSITIGAASESQDIRDL